jgi:hypothetical protein
VAYPLWNFLCTNATWTKKIRKFQEGNDKKKYYKFWMGVPEREKICCYNMPVAEMVKKINFFHLNHETNTFSIAHIESKNRWK